MILRQILNGGYSFLLAAIPVMVSDVAVGLPPPSQHMPSNKSIVIVQCRNPLSRMSSECPRQVSKLHELNFVGPFIPEKALVAKSMGTSWIEPFDIRFRSYSDYEWLSIDYRGKASLDSTMRVHFHITATDNNGDVHTLLDQIRSAPGPRTDIVAGAIVGQGDALSLPVELSSLERLDMRFTRLDR